MARRLPVAAALLTLAACGSLPPPVGSTAVVYVHGPVDQAILPGALAAARARYPGRQISAHDLVEVRCSLDDVSQYSANTVAPEGQSLRKGTIMRVKVNTPLMGIKPSHLDEVLQVISAGAMPAQLPAARNGKLIDYPSEVRRHYVGRYGSTLEIACAAGL